MSNESLPPRSVIYVDDEELHQPIIRQVFAASDSYRFNLRFASRVEEFAEYLLKGESADVCIVDLNLDGRSANYDATLHLGNLVLEALALDQPETLTVVYSAHREIDDIVWALRHGATDFVWKDKNHNDLVNRVVSLLKDREAENNDLLEAEKQLSRGEIVRPSRDDNFLAFANGKVVASGPSRFVTLCRYRQRRCESFNLPPRPVLLELD